ncbi:MAG: ABC transporter permease [Dactylosporangium sp.]|nr:ABC transporter permease [Dactylosporangium sp.]NNJ63690.1 ABC transporter permease [Dactylosporangium sp.]
MKPLAIAMVNLRRALRQPIVVVLYFLMPLALILVLGAAFGGSAEPRVGVRPAGDGPLSTELVARLRDTGGSISVTVFDTEADLVRAVERGELEAGLILPADYDSALAGAGTVRLRYVARSGLTGQRVSAIVSAIVDQEAARIRAARFAAGERSLPFAEALDEVDTTAADVPQVTVEVRPVGTASGAALEGRFDASAYTQLLLFMFMLALASSVGLLETRRLGLTRRMVATPTPVWTIVWGQALGQLAITVAQGLTIMVVSALIFGVRWGDPVAAGALLVAFSLTAASAGMLLGVVARSEQTSSALAVLLGLGLAALGGTMMPLEFFSPAMRTVAHLVTPHAWAVDGFMTLIRHDGNITDITGSLGVLVGAAVVLLGFAAGLMRRSVVR